MQLAAPLTQEQIDAGLEYWKEEEMASQKIRDLKQRHPSPLEGAVEKTLILNEEYFTNIAIGDVPSVSHRVVEVLAKTAATGCDLVEELVWGIKSATGEKPVLGIKSVTGERNYVYASKYVNLFVDPLVPILDSRAEEMVDLHLGLVGQDVPERYHVFHRNLTTLHQAARLTCHITEMDPYLWIAGSFWAWQTRDQAISKWLRPRFEKYLKNGPQSDPLLATLLGRSTPKK